MNGFKPKHGHMRKGKPAKQKKYYNVSRGGVRL